MSLYNMVNGMSAVVFYVMPVLGKHPDWFPRFRDAFLGDPDVPETVGKLIVYTRTGVGNRDHYESENESIRDMPGFLFDYDDSFDSTFANWVFDIPEKWAKDVECLLVGNFSDISDEYVDLCANTYPNISDTIRKNLRRV